jgi:hypothetical protein
MLAKPAYFLNLIFLENLMLTKVEKEMKSQCGKIYPFTIS